MKSKYTINSINTINIIIIVFVAFKDDFFSSKILQAA